MAQLIEVQITSSNGFTTWTVRPNDVIQFEYGNAGAKERGELTVREIGVVPDPNPFLMKNTVWFSGIDGEGVERRVAAYSMTDWLGR